MSSRGLLLDSISLPYQISNFIYQDGEIIFTAWKVTNTNDSVRFGKLDTAALSLTLLKSYDTHKARVIFTGFSYLETYGYFAAVGGAFDQQGSRTAIIYILDNQLNIINYEDFDAFYSPYSTAPYFRSVIENIAGDSLLFLSDSLDSNAAYNGGIALIPMSRNLVRDSVNLHFPVSNVTLPNNMGNRWIERELADLIQLNDSSYLLAGRSINHFLQNNNVRAHNGLAYAVLDKSYNPTYYHFFGQAYDTLNAASFDMIDRRGSHIYLGHTGDLQFGNFFNYDNLLGLTKVDQAGNYLWTRYYSNNDYNFVYGVTACNDGGAILYSNAYDATKNTGQEYDLYFLKVDSLGNRLITGVEEKEYIPSSNFRVYPNPFKEELNLLKVNNFENYTFLLFDAFGRKVKTINWTEDNQKVSTDGLPPGVYVYQLVDVKGRMGSGKIIKQ